MNKNKSPTRRMIEEYLACGGAGCLFCGHPHIEGDSYDQEQGIVSQEIRCTHCDRTWTDLYRLDDVGGEDWEPEPSPPDESAVTPAPPGMYLQLFHGRRDPGQEMDDWGEDGPIFHCPNFVHVTYASDIKLGEIGDENCRLLIGSDGLVYYDGWWYGDWSVYFPDESQRSDEAFLGRLTAFDPAKIQSVPTFEK